MEGEKMKEFYFEQKTNIKVGDKYYGIIAVSTRTYDGVYPVTVDYINWDKEEVIFKIDQPCKLVSCGFSEMNKLIHETEEEAINTKFKFNFEDGMMAY
jgi:hypothetical protein